MSFAEAAVPVMRRIDVDGSDLGSSGPLKIEAA
jgi:hypothetical protein